MIKTRRKAGLIRGLADNEGLATQLATYQTRYGDWRELFRSVDRIDQVTKADIRRVANEVFTTPTEPSDGSKIPRRCSRWGRCHRGMGNQGGAQ